MKKAVPENLLRNTAKEQVLWNRNCCNLSFSKITFPWVAASLVSEDSSIRTDTDLVSFTQLSRRNRKQCYFYLLLPLSWPHPLLVSLLLEEYLSSLHLSRWLVWILRTSSVRQDWSMYPSVGLSKQSLHFQSVRKSTSWCQVLLFCFNDHWKCVPRPCYYLKLTRLCLSLAGGCPTIVSRAGWGARAATSRTTMTTPVSYVVIHHTTGGTCTTKTSCISMMKGFQNYHMDSNGQCRRSRKISYTNSVICRL